jgi:uncharacterized protein YehS (DUF1456 family)
MFLTNNDVLRRLRYSFDFSDSQMIAIFKLADYDVDRSTVSNWLKKERDPDFEFCSDRQLATFLNGFIAERRGKKPGAAPEPEEHLTNNIIFRKLKIALDLQAEDILEILAQMDVKISKHELSSFFRRPDHHHFRPCMDQIFRKFLSGLEKQYRAAPPA